MRLLEHRDQILQAKQTLEEANRGLKAAYVGIDTVIDRICELASPWLSVPDAITRPIIVSLWGMTGTGKTSLVRMLARDHLKRPLIEIDLGTFTGDKDFSLEFYRHYSDYSGVPSIILLDEIQNPRTIDEQGNEVDRRGLRGLWSLLSDGLIVPDVNLERDSAMMTLERIITKFDERDGEPPPKPKPKSEEGEGTEAMKAVGAKPVEEVVGADVSEDEEDECWFLRYSHKRQRWEIDDWRLSNIFSACNIHGFEAKHLMHDRLDTDFRDTLTILAKMLERVEVQPVLDYTKCLIFITGNVDEVYTPAHTTNPDISPDAVYPELSELGLKADTLIGTMPPTTICPIVCPASWTADVMCSASYLGCRSDSIDRLIFLRISSSLPSGVTS